MKQYVKSEKGYCYEIINGIKKRISEEKYMKFSKNSKIKFKKKIHLMKGGQNEMSDSELYYLKYNGFNAKELYDHGAKLDQLIYAEFKAEELRIIFNKNEIIDGLKKFIKNKDIITLKYLLNLKFKIKELIDAGYTIKDLKKIIEESNNKDNYYISIIATIPNITDEIFNEIKKYIVDIKDYFYNIGSISKDSGIKVADLKSIGFNAEELKIYGFNAKELYDGGFTIEELKVLNLSNDELLLFNLNENELKNRSIAIQNSINTDEFNAEELKEIAGITAKELKEKGINNVEKLKNAGFTLKDLIFAKFTLTELKNRGFTVEELRDGDKSLNVKILKDIGFNAKELKNGRFTVEELKNGGFNAEELIKIGFSYTYFKSIKKNNIIEIIKKLKSNNYTLEKLKKLEFPLEYLIDAGYNSNKLKVMGFSIQEIQKTKLSSVVKHLK